MEWIIAHNLGIVIMTLPFALIAWVAMVVTEKISKK